MIDSGVDFLAVKGFALGLKVAAPGLKATAPGWRVGFGVGDLPDFSGFSIRKKEVLRMT